PSQIPIAQGPNRTNPSAEQAANPLPYRYSRRAALRAHGRSPRANAPATAGQVGALSITPNPSCVTASVMNTPNRATSEGPPPMRPISQPQKFASTKPVRMKQAENDRPSVNKLLASAGRKYFGAGIVSGCFRQQAAVLQSFESTIAPCRA